MSRTSSRGKWLRGVAAAPCSSTRSLTRKLARLRCPSGSVQQELYDGLTLLQHRGQDAAGISTSDERRFHTHKGLGLVRDVFDLHSMRDLQGSYGVGHVRYPTSGAGAACSEEAQPLCASSPFGVCLVHNGNLCNVRELEEQLDGWFHLNTESDSEVMLAVLIDELSREQRHHHLEQHLPAAIFRAAQRLMQRCDGAYGVVVQLHGRGLLAFRDPHGIRPLSLGVRHQSSSSDVGSGGGGAGGERGADYAVASESVAFTAQGYHLVGDVQPGEAVFVDLEGRLHRNIVAAKKPFAPCIFEHIYMARPDSVMDGVSVYAARRAMGRGLAVRTRAILEQKGLGADVVIPVLATYR